MPTARKVNDIFGQPAEDRSPEAAAVIEATGRYIAELVELEAVPRGARVSVSVDFAD